MFAILAAIFFGISYIMHGFHKEGWSWFGPTPCLYLGLICLAISALGLLSVTIKRSQ